MGRGHPKRVEPSDMDPGEKGILRAMKPREKGLAKTKPNETQTPHMVSSTIVIGLGSTMLNISLVNIVIFSVERSSLGTAAGLNTVFRNLGPAWGPAVAGTIMDQFKDTLLLLTSPLYRFKYNLTLHIN